jgi:hypothetical protein
MTVRTYSRPGDFKAALEARLRGDAAGVAMTRRRQLLVFDRFLARAAVVFGDGVVLKGGLALEIRCERARTTRDIDLRWIGAPAEALAKLQEAGRRDLGDFLSFEVERDEEHPDIAGEGVVYEGERFVAACKLAGKLYGNPFGVDVAFGEPIFGEPERVTTDDALDFIGVPPPTIQLHPLESHIAEKLHAFTMPRSRPNSRMKDLPDLGLLAAIRELDAGRVRAALELTFDFRRTHNLPLRLPDPPAAWFERYAPLAREDGLPWSTLEALTAAVRRFLDPVLAGTAGPRWDPSRWSWS